MWLIHLRHHRRPTSSGISASCAGLFDMHLPAQFRASRHEIMGSRFTSAATIVEVPNFLPPLADPRVPSRNQQGKIKQVASGCSRAVPMARPQNVMKSGPEMDTNSIRGVHHFQADPAFRISFCWVMHPLPHICGFEESVVDESP